MLLNAHAFGQMATIAFYGVLVAFGGAALMLLLSLLGPAHLRRVPAEAEVKLGTGRGFKPAPAVGSRLANNARRAVESGHPRSWDS